MLARFLAVLIWLIVVLNWVDLAYRYQGGPEWLDSLLHFLGGMWVAALFWYISTKRKFSIFNFQFSILVVILVMLVGGAWELSELIADQFIIDNSLERMQPNGLDTVSDLFFDFLGASIFLILWQCFRKPSLSTAVKSSVVKSG